MVGQAKRVLIVEDDADIRTTVAELLEDEGYHVASVANGLEALDCLRAAHELPDVILLDLMMPKMDGFQFRAEQRADARFSEIPVVLMTAAGDVATRANELQPRGFLKKPFKDIKAILEAIERSVDPS